jgi:hypothetical protein
LTDESALDGFRGIAALRIAFGHGRFLAASAPTPFFREELSSRRFLHGGGFRTRLGRGRGRRRAGHGRRAA